MSLEQTIADLVAASNNLTGTINSKMNEIDQKVDEATASVPDTIRGLSTQTFYIDAVEGDDSNDGETTSTPRKTIKGLQAILVNGSYIQIAVKEGQVHEVQGGGISLNSGNIRFTRWNDTNGISRPVIKWIPEIDPNDTSRVYGYAMGLQNGSFSFNKVDIYADSNGGNLHDSASFIRYRPGHVTVFAYLADITLNDSRLATSSVGYCVRDFSFRSVNVNITDNTNGKSKILDCQTDPKGTVRLEVGTLTLPSGYTITDLVDYEAGTESLHTNIAIA